MVASSNATNSMCEVSEKTAAVPGLPTWSRRVYLFCFWLSRYTVPCESTVQICSDVELSASAVYLRPRATPDVCEGAF